MHQRLPIQLLLWNILRVVRKQDRPGSVPVQKSGYVDDDVQISALDAFYERDGRRVVTSEKCWSGIENKMAEISGEVN